MKDKVIMKDGTVLLNVHTVEQCAGRPCCIHNPSPHHMADWPHSWDEESKQMWRICPHGLGHPDPDDLNHHRRCNGNAASIVTARLWVHTCDGCCQPPTTLSTGTIAARPER
jgi:hypothetical protein